MRRRNHRPGSEAAAGHDQSENHHRRNRGGRDRSRSPEHGGRAAVPGGRSRGGVERYYQLARCFRDEDQRADRQLEFTQIDIEMSFIERDDIYLLIEELLRRIWKVALGIDIVTPFTRLSFAQALDRYGSDKPDMRFGMELADFTEEFRSSAFKVFSGAVANSGVVKALNAK